MTDICVPREQEGSTAVVGNWLVAVGEFVEAHAPLVELETDKVTQEIGAPESGFLEEILLPAGTNASPGSILGRLRPSPRALFPQAPPTELAPKSTGNPQRYSPAVRRAIQQHGIDPTTIPGTGRRGRLTKADVEQAAARTASALPPPESQELRQAVEEKSPTTAQAFGKPSEDHSAVWSIPHDRMRLAIAENMSSSLTSAPHVTSIFEADLSAVLNHRQRHKDSLERGGTALTITAYVVAAAVAAMRAVPVLNSRWHKDRLEVFDAVHVGVGTALGDHGLVVPVIRDAQDLSLTGIASKLTDLTQRARTGALVPADMKGGTFTISNHGVSGSLMAAPVIIHQGQAAILGMGAIKKRVIVREIDGVDTIQIRPMAYVSLTIDHRVVDGHQTNAWLSTFVSVLERWSKDS